VEKISVIVPVYKVEKYLRSCIESIQNQTYKNLEIILIDDGSPDNCGAICDEMAKKDKRIKVIHQENGGVSKARNNGIKAATGDYIGFCDSDDYMDIDMYETLYNTIKKYNADIAMVSLTLHDLTGKEIPVYGSGREIVYNRVEAVEHFLRGDAFCYTGYCHLIKSDLCKSVAFDEKRKMHEDRYFTFELLTKANIISINDTCKYHYVLRGESMTMRPFGMERLDVIYFADKIRDYIKRTYPQLIGLSELNYMRACLDVYKLIIKERAANKRYKNIRRQMKIRICKCKYLEGLSKVRRIEILVLKHFEILYIGIIRLITLWKRIKQYQS
jgi:glycosyltransferase involved in cell wall biosynthesis